MPRLRRRRPNSSYGHKRGRKRSARLAGSTNAPHGGGGRNSSTPTLRHSERGDRASAEADDTLLVRMRERRAVRGLGLAILPDRPSFKALDREVAATRELLGFMGINIPRATARAVVSQKYGFSSWRELHDEVAVRNRDAVSLLRWRL